MIVLTRAQREALSRVWKRHFDKHDLTYRQFRRSVQYPFFADCIMVEAGGMFIGIEKDGYTHS